MYEEITCTISKVNLRVGIIVLSPITTSISMYIYNLYIAVTMAVKCQFWSVRLSQHIDLIGFYLFYLKKNS